MTDAPEDAEGTTTQRRRIVVLGGGTGGTLAANRLRRVVATDIYGSGEFAEREARASMLDDPAAHAPFPYREDHLEVRWMDATHKPNDIEAFEPWSAIAFSEARIMRRRRGSMEGPLRSARPETVPRTARPSRMATVRTTGA